MEKTIITAFMIIVGVVISVMIYNVVYPAAVASSTSLVNMRVRMDDRIQTQVAIIHTTSELDKYGSWHDTNGDGQFSTFVWVKNVGSSRVSGIDQIDLFFGPDGDFGRIPNKNKANGSLPYWQWQIENDSNWNPTSTLKITISSNGPLPRGRYFVKLVLPNGLITETYFSQ